MISFYFYFLSKRIFIQVYTLQKYLQKNNSVVNVSPVTNEKGNINKKVSRLKKYV